MMKLSCLWHAMQHLGEAATSALENGGHSLDEHRVLFSDGMGLVVISEQEVPRRGSRIKTKNWWSNPLRRLAVKPR